MTVIYLISKWRIWLSFRNGWAASLCKWRSFLSFLEWGSFSSFCKWRSFIPIKENEPQAKPQTSQAVSIPHRTQSRGRSEPPMNNGAIFVKRVAPSFLPVMPPASRAFSFLDENIARISHRRSGGKRSGFALTELFCTKIQDGGKLAATCSGSEKPSLNRNILDENWKPHPRQSARCPAVWSEASARMESLSWRKYIFRQEVAQGSCEIWFVWHPRLWFRDQSRIFVTRAWRWFSRTVSDRTAAGLFSWRKSRLFSLGRTEGM